MLRADSISFLITDFLRAQKKVLLHLDEGVFNGPIEVAHEYRELAREVSGILRYEYSEPELDIEECIIWVPEE